MRKIKVKVPAKINLALDVVGVKDNFHLLNSLVASIDLFDRITLTKRKDRRVTITERGIKSRSKAHDNLAYKAAKLFMEEFSTLGVDIIIEKGIPVGAGLGGSSADIAGVLLGMKDLYQVNQSVINLANRLGSDSGYMLKGGYAFLEGRGEKITYFDYKQSLPLLIVTNEKSVSTKISYTTFDKQGVYYEPCAVKAKESLTSGKYDEFYSLIKNDLYNASISIVPSIKENCESLIKQGAKASFMTGSGSAVVGIFSSNRARNLAYKKLLPKFKNKVIKAKTIF